jgi:glycosyltransferase involved in cell wall biosynthesis
VYIHTPIDSTCEAFGQTYVEALASEVPSVFTLSGIAAEFIRHGENALVVDFKNSDQIYDALYQLWSDEKMRDALSDKGKRSINPEFTLTLMLHRLKELYNEQ